MNIAVYGGSFNPPHAGHAAVISYILATQDVDRVIVVPCASHPFQKDLVAFDHRFAMCLHMTSIFDDAKVVVSSIEQGLPKPSYTCDTLRALRVQYPLAHVSLVLGADAFEERKNWKNWNEIEASTKLIVIGRAGWDNVGYDCEADVVLTPPLLHLSSTSVRNMIGWKIDVTSKVGKPVASYIKDHGLYS